MKLVEKFNTWLYSEYDFVDGRTLGAFRIFFSACMLLFGVIRFMRIVNYSAQLYKPQSSLAIWFDLPTPHFFLFLDYLILVLVLFLLFGFKTRWTSIFLSISLLIGQTFLFSFGKIDHGYLLISFLPMVMSFSNWGSCFSVDSKRGEKTTHTWPISLMSLILGFGMFTAGLQKLIGGWLNPKFPAIRSHVFSSYINEREGIMTTLFLDIKSSVFWESLDIMIVLFELGFLIVVLSRKWFNRWIAFAILFHVGVVLTMNIPFSQNVIIYFLFLNWTFILKGLRFQKFLEGIQPVFSIYVMAVFVGFFLAIKYFYGQVYLIPILHLSRLTSSFILFGLAGFVIIGSFFYERRNKVSK